ncbi:hypothetical protein SLS58_009192 [Diplodia intermedia]|uniref:Uncharacterized protein n=1 Tax=Diplodia intermedia TaxID=856260 RepID=A0ABR3TDW2_9PEZI
MPSLSPCFIVSRPQGFPRSASQTIADQTNQTTTRPVFHTRSRWSLKQYPVHCVIILSSDLASDQLEEAEENKRLYTVGCSLAAQMDFVDDYVYVDKASGNLKAVHSAVIYSSIGQVIQSNDAGAKFHVSLAIPEVLLVPPLRPFPPIWLSAQETKATLLLPFSTLCNRMTVTISQQKLAFHEEALSLLELCEAVKLGSFVQRLFSE